MKTRPDNFLTKTRTSMIFFLVSGLIFILDFGSLPGLSAEGKEPEEFPEEITGTMEYNYNAHDTAGCWNVPHCEYQICTTVLDLNFKLIETKGNQAEYKAMGGSWQLIGSGSGSLTETFADEVCTVTIKEVYSGTGSFDSDGLNSATLTYNRSNHSFTLAFIIATGKVAVDINYTCMGKNYNDTSTYYAMGESVGTAVLSDGDLTFDLGYSSTSTNSNIPGSKYDHIASGKLTGAGLKADFSVTPETRGQVSLDASKSTGKIKKYTWTFSGAAEEKGIKFNGEAKLEGKKVNVVLLVPLTVKLTVENEKGVKKSKEKKINIQPREWETVAEHQDEPGAFDSVVLKAKNGEAPMGIESARNSCAYNDNHPGLIFHPPGQGSGFSRTFENIGYTIDKVSNGPFEGTFYIKEPKIEIIRKPFLNSNFFAGTAFYELNIKHHTGIQEFIESTKEHERLHTKLLQEALKKQNPAKELEKLFAQNHDGLKNDADQLLSTMETDLKEVYEDEEEVKRRMYDKYGDKKCKLVFEDVDSNGKTIERSYFLYNKSQSKD